MNLKHILYLLLLLVALSSCYSNGKDDPEEIHTRTVLVYIAAENSLSSYAFGNIQSMITGAKSEHLQNGNLLVYLDSRRGAPQLIQIAKNELGEYDQIVLKEYEEQNSASVEVMRGVINEVLGDDRFEADSYGLILWSHGTAWLPQDYKNMLRSFGQDGENWMEINELAKALPDNRFDFILFDACYMASIEVAYALRNKADYIIASPTEILAGGFPYQTMLEPMFRKEADLVAICEQFYNYYDNRSGMERSASISLVQTDKLEGLASAARQILQGKGEGIEGLNLSEVQALDHLVRNRQMLYDFDHFINQVATGSNYEPLNQALSQAIIYAKSTPSATYGYGGGTVMAINHFCGLSSYVPQSVQVELNEWYRSLDWYKAVYQ